MSNTITPQTVLHFWYHTLTPDQWFTKDSALDQQIQHRFQEITEAAAQGECVEWRYNIYGRLAEIIVLDQFSRNIWRDTPRAFAQDNIALVLAQEALQCPSYPQLKPIEKQFLLMPYMHSESAYIHEQALALFAQIDIPQVYEYEVLHKRIIDRFGRYPHRNAILNRPSTPEEEQFLLEPNSSF